MALFALWPADEGLQPEAVQQRLQAQSHIEPELCVTHRLGRWQLSVFATATRFYTPDRQLWHDPATGEACVVHGLLWLARDRPELLDARGVAALLSDPSQNLPEDIAGEYAVLRVFADGQVLAVSDPAGMQPVFHTTGAIAALANRAGFLPAIQDDWRTDACALLWLPVIGYRVGEGTAYRGVRAVRQGMAVMAGHGRFRFRRLPRPVIAFPHPRGYASGGAALLEEGIVQGRAAIHLATAGEERVNLPITGGKDSRAVLALCLSAGLHSRLRLFTRGYEGHADVVVGRMIAEACGLPHERQPPLGSDTPAFWTLDMFVDRLAAQTFQTDGMVGGWDLILGHRTGADTLVTGHMGEVLKAYAKRPMAGGPLDPVEMVRLQAPFDPLGLLRAEAAAALRTQLRAQMDDALRQGAAEADLPDVFYFRNRVPNWLGAIRGIKAFERQPVTPLGVPALMRLAFLLTPEERKMEVAHFRLVDALAPHLVPLPFALQQWDERLGCGIAAPVTSAPASGQIFGNWQYSLNHNPAIRTWLAEFFARTDLPLWQFLQRDLLIDQLRHMTFGYFECISMLGLVIAAFQQSGLVRRERLTSGQPTSTSPDDGHARSTKTVRPAPCGMRGHLDTVTGPVQPQAAGTFRITGAGTIAFHGWLQAPDMPGARVAMTATCRGRVLAMAVADQMRPDLARAGIGDGAHAFALSLDTADLPDEDADIVLAAFDHGFMPVGGHVTLQW